MKRIPALLAAATLAALTTLAADEIKPAPPAAQPPLPKTVKNVGVEDFAQLIAARTNVVLDVRTAAEFQAGHIPGAINLDFNSPDFAKKVAALDKSKTYLVHCAGGVRSAKACAVMDKTDFPRLVNLEPGFKAWEKAGQPVEKK